MKSAIASVIALGSAVFLSPAHADTYVFTTTIAVPPSALTTEGLFINSTSAFSTPSRN